MNKNIITGAILASVCGLASQATAQVVINEVWENVPGDSDVFDVSLEHIELYGVPGTDLTGYAVALLKGGADLNSDGFPEGYTEIDEAFSLDGIVIPSNGIVVVYNDTAGFSDIPFYAAPESVLVSFTQAHLAPTGLTVDTPGKLGNDGSSSYILVRRRPGHDVVNGASVYNNSTYAFYKDIIPDVDFDGKLDFGNEPSVAGADPASVIDPLQIIDGVAWSNQGGKEFTRTKQDEISDTPGFNPDGISRVNYFFENPNLGLRLNSDGETVSTRIADESWIYGEQGPGDGAFTYLPADSGAPTDPTGDGFQDIDISGFEMTPGNINDAGGIKQFRFVRGDFNFDWVVDQADADAIAASLGESLDRTTQGEDTFGNPVDVWYYEGPLANALIAMMNMDQADGTNGANADTVTQSDLDTFNTEFGFGNSGCNIADVAEPRGTLNIDDVLAFLGAFASADPAADVAAPQGTFNIDDVLAFLSAFASGCP